MVWTLTPVSVPVVINSNKFSAVISFVGWALVESEDNQTAGVQIVIFLTQIAFHKADPSCRKWHTPSVSQNVSLELLLFSPPPLHPLHFYCYTSQKTITHMLLLATHNCYNCCKLLTVYFQRVSYHLQSPCTVVSHLLYKSLLTSRFPISTAHVDVLFHWASPCAQPVRDIKCFIYELLSC